MSREGRSGGGRVNEFAGDPQVLVKLSNPAGVSNKRNRASVRVNAEAVLDHARTEHEGAGGNGALLVAEPEGEFAVEDEPRFVFMVVPVAWRARAPRRAHLGHCQVSRRLVTGRLVGEQTSGEPERLPRPGIEQIAAGRNVEGHSWPLTEFTASAALLSCRRVWRILSTSSRCRLVGTSSIRAQTGIRLTS